MSQKQVLTNGDSSSKLIDVSSSPQDVIKILNASQICVVIN